MNARMTTAEKVEKVHATGGTITLHTPTGERHRCTVTECRDDMATFAWSTWRGVPQRITLRIR